MDLERVVDDIADVLKIIDSSGVPFKGFRAGVGPYGEPQLVKLVAEHLNRFPPYALGVKTMRTPDLLIVPMTAGLSINIEDVDLENQRYRWRQNTLELAARHPSFKRYLGDKEHNFPGQETKHFRLLVAEVVADAVCARLVSHNVQANPEEYEDADWDTYYAQYSKYMTQFLPIAHRLQYPDAELK